MDNIRLAFRFWITAMIKSLRAVINFFKDDLKNVLWGIPLFLIISWLAGNVSGFASNNSALISAIVPSVLTVLVFCVLVSMYQAAMMYKDMGGFLESPLELNLLPREKSGNPSLAWVQLEVFNKSVFRVTSCRLRVLSATDRNTGEQIMPTAEYITWSGRNQDDLPSHTPLRGNSEMVINGKDRKICDIAQTIDNNHRAKFTITHNDPRYIGVGQYNVVVEVVGVWHKEGKELGFSDTRKFWLSYGGEDKLETGEHQIGKKKTRKTKRRR